MKILNENDLLNLNSENSFSIDRFEDKFAICQNKITEEMVLIPLYLLPTEAKSGDILIIKNNSLFIDSESTKREQEDIKNLVNKLFRKS